MLARFQFFAKFLKVINLPVEQDRQRSSFVPDGLPTARKIDNAQPTRPRGHRRSYNYPFVVGSPMNHCCEHTADQSLTHVPRATSDHAADSAHAGYVASKNAWQALRSCCRMRTEGRPSRFSPYQRSDARNRIKKITNKIEETRAAKDSRSTSKVMLGVSSHPGATRLSIRRSNDPTT